MAVRYPKYQSQALLSASIVTPPSIDQAAFRAQAKSAQTLTAAADRVISFALDRGKTQAQFEGRRAGAENPDRTLQAAMTETPTNARQIAAYNAAVDVSIAEIDLDSREAVAQALFDAEKNETKPSDLYATLQDIELGYQSAIDLVDPVKGEALRSRISAIAMTGHLNYSAQYLAIEKKRVSNKWVKGFPEIQIIVEGAARSVKQDHRLWISKYLIEGENLGVEEHLLMDAESKLLGLAADARVRGEFQRAFDKGEGEEYLKKFNQELRDRKVVVGIGGDAAILPAGDETRLNSLIHGLTDTRIKVLRAEMQTQINGVITANSAKERARNADLKGEIGDAQTIVNDARNPGVDRIDDLVARASATGDEGLIEDATILRGTSQVVEDMSDMLPEAARDFYQEFERLYREDGITSAENAVLEAAEASMNRTESDFAQDPVAALMDRDLIASDELTPETILAEGSLGDKKLRRRADAVARSPYPGITSIFTKPEMRQIDAFLNDPNLTVENALAVVTRMVNATGDKQATAILEQFSMEHASLWVAGADIYRRTQDSGLLENILRGVLSEQLPEETLPGRNADMREALTPFFGLDSTRIETRHLAAEAAARGAQISGDSRDFIELYGEALQQIYGRTGLDDAAKGGVSWWGGEPIWHSPERHVNRDDYLWDNRDDLTEAIITVAGSSLEMIGGLHYDAGGGKYEPVEPIDYENLRFTSLNLPAGFVYVLNTEGKPLLDENGRRYIVPIDHLVEALFKADTD
jgi:hypothetical protein